MKGFLAKNPSGGMHHVCYEVEDILAARDKLKAEGARVLGDGKPKIGAHDKPVLFLHPKDFCGTLVELEQVVILLALTRLAALGTPAPASGRGRGPRGSAGG